MNKSLSMMCLVLAVNLISCKAKTADSAAGDGSTTAGSGLVTAPTYGMSCSGNGGAGWDTFANPVFIVPSITGNFVNSVQLSLSLRPQSGYPNLFSDQTRSKSLTLTAYTCGTSSSLGTQVATATASPSLYTGNKAVVFTFSTPIAMPSCPSATALVFKLTDSAATTGYTLNGYSYVSGGSCTDKMSTSSTAVVPGTRAWEISVVGSL